MADSARTLGGLVAVAPSFILGQKMSPRRMAQQRALAVLAGMVLAVGFGFILSVFTVIMLGQKTHGPLIWAIGSVLVSCVTVPLFRSEFIHLAARLNAP